MAVYSDTDFNSDKRLRFEPRLVEPGPCSQDLHVGQLYTLPNLTKYVTEHSCSNARETVKKAESIFEMPWDDFKVHLDKVSIAYWNGTEAWLLKPRRFYFAETVEKLTLPEGLSIEVDTRSSWARYGVRVQQADDRMRTSQGYEGHVPLYITAVNVPVVLRPRDRVCHAVVSDVAGRFSDEQILEAFKNGDMKFSGPEGCKLQVRDEAICLTLYNTIRTFRGRMIDPRKDVSDSYNVTDIAGGLVIPEKTFFLSSSNEIIEMGNRHVGLLREHSIYRDVLMLRDVDIFKDIGLSTHLNSGYHVPGSNGTLTFEQYLHSPRLLKPRMPMGELEIMPLRSPCSSPYNSKYRGQIGPTATRPDNSSIA